MFFEMSLRGLSQRRPDWDVSKTSHVGWEVACRLVSVYFGSLQLGIQQKQTL